MISRRAAILPAWLVDRWAGHVINIHDSFLPSFAGARPYARARTQGQGHRRDRALRDAGTRRGRDIEAVVLAEAVRLDLEHRVIVYGRRTAVFD